MNARASTLLGVAGARGSLEMMHFLIESGARPDGVRNEPYGETLLHQAAHRGDPELIRLLADHGVDANARDDEQDTPLHEAAIHGHRAAVALLIELGADVNTSNYAQYTPLMVAANRNHPHIAQLLLDSGADPTRTNYAGKTALDIASNKNSKGVRQLLEAIGQSPSRAAPNEKPVLPRKTDSAHRATQGGECGGDYPAPRPRSNAS